ATTRPDSPTTSRHGSALAEVFRQFQYPTPPLKITLNTLARAYNDAGYFERNVRTIEVLVDRVSACT
ncbi:hypothetical protein, partial [Streptomyces sp. NPDC002403]